MRAERAITAGEPVLTRYCPPQEFERWRRTFKCRCCQCRGICNSNSAPPEDESNFSTRISTQQASAGLITSTRIEKDDFVIFCQPPHHDPNQPSFCEGTVVSIRRGRATVQGFCKQAKKLRQIKLSTAALTKVGTKHMWANPLLSEAATTVWGSKSGGEAQGGWLNDTVVDAAIRWTLFGDTTRHGLAACATKNWYIPNSALHELQAIVENKLGPAAGGGSTLQRLLKHLEHERAGQNWLKANGVPIDPSTLDNLFAVFNPDIRSGSGSQARGVHYFLLQCKGKEASVSISDALAQSTQQNHKLFLVLAWAIVVASASCQDFPLWHTAPVLTLSEEEVIHQFGGLLLDRSGNEQQDAKLSVQEHECLQSMRIQTRPRTGASAETEWHWTGVDRGFPQQSNGKDCGMTVIAAAAHLARGWQTPPMNENSMNQYRWWLCSAITEDSKIATPVSCSHCGTRLYRTTPSYTRCVDRSQCEQVRNESDDALLMGEDQGTSSGEPSRAQVVPAPMAEHARATSKQPKAPPAQETPRKRKQEQAAHSTSPGQRQSKPATDAAPLSPMHGRTRQQRGPDRNKCPKAKAGQAGRRHETGQASCQHEAVRQKRRRQLTVDDMWTGASDTRESKAGEHAPAPVKPNRRQPAVKKREQKQKASVGAAQHWVRPRLEVRATCDTRPTKVPSECVCTM